MFRHTLASMLLSGFLGAAAFATGADGVVVTLGTSAVVDDELAIDLGVVAGVALGCAASAALAWRFAAAWPVLAPPFLGAIGARVAKANSRTAMRLEP